LLPVENPGYIFVRDNAATMEEDYKSFHQEEGIIIVQTIIDNLFEEALGFRVSSEYGRGHGTAEEE
jgi:superfamily I DNA and/or RNA helicase